MFKWYMNTISTFLRMYRNGRFDKTTLQDLLDNLTEGAMHDNAIKIYEFDNLLIYKWMINATVYKYDVKTSLTCKPNFTTKAKNRRA